MKFSPRWRRVIALSYAFLIMLVILAGPLLKKMGVPYKVVIVATCLPGYLILYWADRELWKNVDARGATVACTGLILMLVYLMGAQWAIQRFEVGSSFWSAVLALGLPVCGLAWITAVVARRVRVPKEETRPVKGRESSSGRKDC